MSQASDLLRAMADQIDKNEGSGFGGCFVICPPEGGGKPISVLLLDNANDAAQFWGLIGPKAQIALAEITQQQKAPPGFPRR